MDRLLARIRLLLFPWIPLSRAGPSPFIRDFSCKEIKRATGNFSTIIRTSSDGIVYKAQFPDGLVASVIEVKCFQKKKEAFDRQVQLLARLNHRHLVTFRGISIGNDRFILFDYMENCSLKELLHDPLKTPLNWRTRLQIAIDVAAALEYLHCFCDPPVYHISINSNNILLDENFVAKISDVSFFNSDGNLIPKSDAQCSGNADQKLRHSLFQFGVLLLELITGQSFGNEDSNLVEWVQGSAFNDSIHRMVDTDLEDSYDSREIPCFLGEGSVTVLLACFGLKTYIGLTLSLGSMILLMLQVLHFILDFISLPSTYCFMILAQLH